MKRVVLGEAKGIVGTQQHLCYVTAVSLPVQTAWVLLIGESVSLTQTVALKAKVLSFSFLKLS